MFRSRAWFFALVAALFTASCDSPVEPSLTGGPARNPVSLPSNELMAPQTTPANFYEACLANGSLSSVSSIGNATSPGVVCKGKGTAIVLRAGAGVGFCYQTGKTVSDFTAGGVPSCNKGKGTAGGFASGTDYYGCVVNGNLTGVATVSPACKGTVAGFSKPKNYNLTVVAGGTGTGSVTSSVGGINCPGVCLASLVENTSVTLTRAVGAGSSFGGWSDSTCTGATCSVLLTSNVTVTTTFTVQDCTPSLAIDGTPAGSDSLTQVLRKDPFDLRTNLQLTGGSCGSWTTQWTYKFGDSTAVPVPADWIIGDTLRVPRWTLEKYTAFGKRYTFTLTATPPAGSGLSPLTAMRVVHVNGTRPTAGFSPTGFTQAIASGAYSYLAFGGTPATVDPDNPPGSARLIYVWYAEHYGGDEIVPDSGQGTPTVTFTWPPLDSYLIRLTVCPGDEPYPYSPEGLAWTYGSTGCTTTTDFIFTTTS